MMSTRRFFGGNDGGCSSMVELRFVVPAVAGSSPVSHPFPHCSRQDSKIQKHLLVKEALAPRNFKEIVAGWQRPNFPLLLYQVWQNCSCPLL